MADLSQTITNAVNCFGMGASSKWGANWGEFLWGEGTNDVAVDVGKLITNSQAQTTAVPIDTNKVIVNTQASTSTLSFDTDKVIANSQASVSTLRFDTDKVIANSQAATTVLTFDTNKVIANTQASDVTLYFGQDKFISESVTVVGDLADEYLQDSDGYYYMFPDRATDAEDRDFATWSSGTAGAPSWTSGAVSSASWSQA